MKINLSNCKVFCFTWPRAKDPLNYTLGEQFIPEASICKYLRLILRIYLNWADHVIYMAEKAWKALHFIMCIFKMGNSSIKV